MIKTTRAQRETLHRIWTRYHRPNETDPDQGESYRSFRRRVSCGFGWVGIEPIPGGLYIGIEPDGFSHT